MTLVSNRESQNMILSNDSKMHAHIKGLTGLDYLRVEHRGVTGIILFSITPAVLDISPQSMQQLDWPHSAARADIFSRMSSNSLTYICIFLT